MAKRNTTPPILTEEEIQRFWAFVDKSPGQGPKGDCWEWQGATSPYGKFTNHFRGRSFSSHCLAFFLVNNHWPTAQINHHCDNPPCCNSRHLYEGTQQDNLNDAKARNRTAKGDSNGARLYPERLSRGDSHYMRNEPNKVPRGSNHGMSKLTEKDVLWIRSQYAARILSGRQIARLLNVSNPLVYMVINRQIWKHV